MSALFSELKIKKINFRNRIFVSPMCQYSSPDGMPNDWHLVHLGSRAVGGAALVMTEAISVSAEGRISPYDLGIWHNQQYTAFLPITNFIKKQGAVPGIQLSHAGRKASTLRPWEGGGPLKTGESLWQSMAPSPIPFAPEYPTPKEMNSEDLENVIDQFRQAAGNSLHAGFKVLELHMAHGYLLHQFLSPLSNQRGDGYGGDFKNRIRFPLLVTRAVREVWPDNLPLFVRISCTDWAEKGWDLEQSIALSKRLKETGVDLIDCSSGGLLPGVKIPVSPGYQLPFAAKIKKAVGIPTTAVGLITQAQQAEQIIAFSQADAVFLAREMLRNPYWPLQAAKTLGVDLPWPVQYLRAK
jgi:2,4-dienoyl-CoA reductase-like NADH-dependent reductase (Old Yellow Enzyme family)